MICFLVESSVFFSDAYQERVLNAMGHSLANMVEEWNEKPSDENLMLLKMQDFERYRSLEGDDDEIFRGNIRLEIEATEGSFKTYLVNTELEAMQEHVERIKSAEEISRRIYGNRYVNSQDRFLLLPLKVELNNGKEGTDTKLAAIDGMLEDEKKQRIEKFQDFLAVGGLVATLIFGLPAIRETVEILRHICVFWSDDIPNISIDGLSVALWVAVNLFMVLKLARRPISNSNSG